MVSTFQRFLFSQFAPCLGFEKTNYRTIYAKIPYLLKLRTHLYSVAEQHFVKAQAKIAKRESTPPCQNRLTDFWHKKQGFLHTPRWQKAYDIALLTLPP